MSSKPRDRRSAPGIGGLVCALLLRRAGLRRDGAGARRERPGGKMREVERRRGRIDAGPTVLHHAPGVRAHLRARPALDLAEHLSLTARNDAGAACLERRASGSTCSPTPPDSADAIGGFRRRRGRRRATSPSAGMRPACSRRWSARSSTAPAPSMPGLIASHGPRAACRASSISALLLALEGARRLFPGPAPAPALRPLRHLLRLLALPFAGDADADRACGATGVWLVEGGMHRLARRWRAGTGAGRDVPLWRAYPRDPGERRPRDGRDAGGWRDRRSRRRRLHGDTAALGRRAARPRGFEGRATPQPGQPLALRRHVRA